MRFVKYAAAAIGVLSSVNGQAFPGGQIPSFPGNQVPAVPSNPNPNPQLPGNTNPTFPANFPDLPVNPTFPAGFPNTGNTNPTFPAGFPDLPANPTFPAGFPNTGNGNPTFPAGFPDLPSGLPTFPAGFPSGGEGFPTFPAGFPSGIPTFPAGFPSGGEGFPTFPPGFPGAGGNGEEGGFPTIPDFNFDNIFGGNGFGSTCTVQCALGTICINNNECITPQPMCATPCGANQFCQSAINATLMANINNLLSAQSNIGIGGGIPGGIPSGAGLPPIGANGEISFPGVPDLSTLLSAFNGDEVRGSCQSAENKCTAGCPAGQVCSPFQGCVPCAVCGGFDLTGFLSGGAADLSRFTANFSVPRGNGNAQTIQPGFIADIQAGLNTWTSLTLGGSGSVGGSGAALLPIPAGSQAQAQQFISTLQDAALQIAAGGVFTAQQLVVRANATLNVVLSGASARGSATAGAQLDGPLIIRGLATAAEAAKGLAGGFFSFPATATNLNPNAIINAAGNVQFSGDLGQAKLSIAAISAAAAAAGVPTGQLLKTAGNVIGSAGNLIVNGTLQMSGWSFEPRLSIPAGGIAKISPTTGNFSCGDLFLSARGQLDLLSTPAKTAFKNFTACEAGAVIRVNVPSVSAAKSGVLFGYGAIPSAVVRSAFRCTIKLFDAAGGEITLVNPNTATASRRLLADAPTVQWTATGASYSGGSPAKVGQATSTASPISMVAVIIAAIVARLL